MWWLLLMRYVPEETPSANEIDRQRAREKERERERERERDRMRVM